MRPRPENPLIVAIDVSEMAPAVALADALAPHAAMLKVGLELFSASGPDAVVALTDLGYDVFLDLKLHDIPTTVEKAARVAGALGVSYLTIHSMGGPVMLRAGVEGFIDGTRYRLGREAWVGITGPNWTTDPTWLKPSLALVSLWSLLRHIRGRALQPTGH